MGNPNKFASHWLGICKTSPRLGICKTSPRLGIYKTYMGHQSNPGPDLSELPHTNNSQTAPYSGYYTNHDVRTYLVTEPNTGQHGETISYLSPKTAAAKNATRESLLEATRSQDK
jgi:hypothetical protein